MRTHARGRGSRIAAARTGRATRAATRTCVRRAGSSTWNAVSKQATAGTSGTRRCMRGCPRPRPVGATAPAGSSASSACDHVVVERHGSTRWCPPWTTRCPTASIAPQPSTKADQGIERRRATVALCDDPSSASSSRSLRLDEPPLTTRTRTADAGSAGPHPVAHVRRDRRRASRVYARGSQPGVDHAPDAAPRRRRQARAPDRSRRSRGGTGPCR